MRRLRFSMRTLLIAVLVFGTSAALGLRWWTQPYVITGSYPDGGRAWEQWERRSLAGKIVHVRTIRFHRNGRTSYEHDFRNGETTCLTPEGRAISKQQWYSQFADDMQSARQDPASQRPMTSFLGWWNGW